MRSTISCLARSRRLGLHVLGEHAERRVERDHEIDPLALDLDEMASELRAGERDDDERVPAPFGAPLWRAPFSSSAPARATRESCSPVNSASAALRRFAPTRKRTARTGTAKSAFSHSGMREAHHGTSLVSDGLRERRARRREEGARRSRTARICRCSS